MGPTIPPALEPMGGHREPARLPGLPMALPRPDPEKTRRIVGLVIYVVMMLGGLAILTFPFLIEPLNARDPDVAFTAMGIGAACALPMLAVYIWIPRLIDRFDPEPLWALALVLGWGLVAACGVAYVFNSVVEVVVTELAGKEAGHVVGLTMSAPFIEEGMKGLAVLGVFYFLRREFDGVVDGVIYATFVALGFAATENILYYSRAAIADPSGDVLAATLLIRGVLSPWGHPLYTSMTGLGFGISRETNKTWLKWLAPLGGYCCAMFLHSVWNGASAISGGLVIIMLPLWILFVLGFIGILIWLVVRKGRIIRMHLQDEVLLGTITREELVLVTSPFAGMKATFGWGGAAGRRFVRAAARLGLSKWHAGRAMQGRKKTVSADWIVPLRQELAELRVEVARSMGRPVPMPQPWVAQPGQQAGAYGPQAVAYGQQAPGYGQQQAPGYGPQQAPGYGPQQPGAPYPPPGGWGRR